MSGCSILCLLAARNRKRRMSRVASQQVVDVSDFVFDLYSFSVFALDVRLLLF